MLNAPLKLADLNTSRRIAAFLAQVAHESGQLRYLVDITSGAAQEGNKQLGNVKPGDGSRYKGRGPLQLTGRTAYTEAGKALSVNLVDQPDQASAPDLGFRVAAWMWSSLKLNRFADQGDLDSITFSLTGGYVGKADRDRYFKVALDTLSSPADKSGSQVR